MSLENKKCTQFTTPYIRVRKQQLRSPYQTSQLAANPTEGYTIVVMLITKLIQDAISQALQSQQIGFEGVGGIQHPSDRAHGDYASNIALIAFKSVNTTFASPRALAEVLVQEMQANSSSEFKLMISQVEVAGPGFINFTLSQHALLEGLQASLSLRAADGQRALPEQLRESDQWAGKKIMTEFTDPNPFKELHIGHLYSNSVGEAISRLLETQGAEVKRVCYQGDVGLHVAKSIWGMRQKLQAEFSGEEVTAALDKMAHQPLSTRVKFLGQSYALGATAYEDQPEAQTEIKQINFMAFRAGQETLIERGDWEPQVDYAAFIADSNIDYDQIKHLYQVGRRWSLEYFDSMYARVGMKFDDFFFESLVGEFGVQIVREFLAKGVFEESQGAIIFPGKKYGLHDRVFINSLGLPTYEAKELGLAPEKYRRYPYDYSIIITGNEINEYFKVLLQALTLTRPDLAAKTIHLSHGMVRLPEGKMSSRTGKILTAEWLMDEAHAQAREKVDEVRANKQSELDNPEQVAEAVALGAIKYAFLKNGIGGDISFSFKESLSFQGNSGPYLQYTFVRCQSIWQKALTLLDQSGSADANLAINKHIDTLLNSKSYLNHSLNKQEIDLLRNIYAYFETLAHAAQDRAPHYLCTQLYELAQSFNAFYGENLVVPAAGGGESVGLVELTSPQTSFRLLLVAAVAQVLRHGLDVLGIATVERM